MPGSECPSVTQRPVSTGASAAETGTVDTSHRADVVVPSAKPRGFRGLFARAAQRSPLLLAARERPWNGQYGRLVAGQGGSQLLHVLTAALQGVAQRRARQSAPRSLTVRRLARPTALSDLPGIHTAEWKAFCAFSAFCLYWLPCSLMYADRSRFCRSLREGLSR